ncbi:hemolysin family protein [Paenirhodobacter populi]|uniref:HlyC/CorC family transporter n=1 Tax=Paenirhodobacter populi TaxID=2306993 RepID=A0A443JGE7_9RHOB|nr:hemolysin family protein [Sinirhodobacter populi]RWR19540.1 HlyC/CorC family transporter [Sinirhodobacter populi]
MDFFDWTILVKLSAVFVLVVANGFFVASEFSLVALRRSRIDQMRNEGHPLGQELTRASDNLDAYLAATQIGITLSSLGLGWIGEPAVAAVLGPLFSGLPAPLNWLGTHTAAFIIAFSLVTFLHVVFGELLPKSLAIQRSEQVALRITRPLAIFLLIFRPLLYVLNGFANWVLRKIGLDPATGEGHLYSMEELRLLISASNEAGLIHKAQGNLVDRALTMGDRKALAYMTPAVDLEWVELDRPLATIRAQMLASPYSRFPVRIGDGFGIITAKTILGLDPALPSLPPEAITEAVFVPEHARVLQVMEEFRRKHLECVLILDEHGDLEGMLTTHDLFDALAGDSRSQPQTVKMKPRKPGATAIPAGIGEGRIFDAGLPLDEFARMINHPFLGVQEYRWYNTLAGFVLEQMKQIPQVGQCFVHDGLLFEVAEMQERRITRVLVQDQTRQRS